MRSVLEKMGTEGWVGARDREDRRERKIWQGCKINKYIYFKMNVYYE